VLSYTVGRRTQELGVRGALGATRGRLTALVLVDAARLTAIGLAIGLPLASVAIRPIESGLHGTSRTDPLVYVVVGAVVMLVTLTASLLPARRASRVDPIVALRA
jgi:putative ABC transport system permease protein